MNELTTLSFNDSGNAATPLAHGDPSCYRPCLAGKTMDDKATTDKIGERIAKVIARAGLASRREAEAWIASGRVSVNGETIRSPARDVTDRDLVVVDGQPLPARERTRLFLYHKPRGLLTTHADPRGRPTIFAQLPPDLPRLISVGRLDFNTEGLLLLTNDGALARILELPATGWLRRYRVRAHGAVAPEKLEALREGVTISGIHYGSIDAAIERVQGSNLWLSFGIREGKNREVRNVLAHLGLTVTRLIRVSFGPFQLRDLAEGAVEEVRTRVLREQLGDKLIAQSGADFSTPVAAAETRIDDAAADRPRATENRPRGRDDLRQRGDAPRSAPRATSRQASTRTPRQAPKHAAKKAPHHAWRVHEEERPGKKLRRKFHGSKLHGSQPDGETRTPPRGQARAELVTDRKGRRVAVERYGEPPPAKPPRRQEPKAGPDRAPKRGRPGADFGDRKAGRDSARTHHRRSSDRASGPRPRHPHRGR
jgi:23S rRNA pseudouridine2605 synthase